MGMTMTEKSPPWATAEWEVRFPPRLFFLRPAEKDYLWGGNRLNDDFSRDIGMTPLAETLECSTHPDGLSTVADRDCIFVPADSVAILIHG